MTDHEKSLATDIHAFLKAYGKRDASEPQEWGSPDAAMLEAFAKALEAGATPQKPFSSWESGGYGPYGSQEGRTLHDSLIRRIDSHLKGLKKA